MAIPIVLDWDQYIYDKLLNHNLSVRCDCLTNCIEFTFNDGSISHIPHETYINDYQWLIDECGRQTEEREEKSSEQEEAQAET